MMSIGLAPHRTQLPRSRPTPAPREAQAKQARAKQRERHWLRDRGGGGGEVSFEEKGGGCGATLVGALAAGRQGPGAIGKAAGAAGHEVEVRDDNAWQVNGAR